MNSSVEIFLFCYNESIIIRQTIEHYKRLLPRCSITILDNKSNDGCTNIARQLGCKIVPFDTQNQLNDNIHTVMRNQHWKKFRNKWIIFADMDEWLYINEHELLEEDRKGTTILQVRGYNIFGDSKTADCSDVDLHRLSSARLAGGHNKKVCFKAGQITEMNFSDGGHHCDPKGNVKYSDKEYILVHMDYLGLPYKLHKQSIRFARSHQNRARGLGTHYAIPDEEYIKDHQNTITNCIDISDLIQPYL
jgi:hypothetical protein